MIEGLNIPEIGIVFARLTSIPFILFNLSWTASGFWNFLRGKNMPTNIYQSVVFLLSVVLIGYTIINFTFGKETVFAGDVGGLILQLIALGAMIIATAGRILAIHIKFEDFYWLFNSNNLDLAVRLGRLNEIDSELAHQLMDSMETNFFTLRTPYGISEQDT